LIGPRIGWPEGSQGWKPPGGWPAGITPPSCLGSVPAAASPRTVFDSTFGQDLVETPQCPWQVTALSQASAMMRQNLRSVVNRSVVNSVRPCRQMAIEPVLRPAWAIGMRSMLRPGCSVPSFGLTVWQPVSSRPRSVCQERMVSTLSCDVTSESGSWRITVLAVARAWRR
jgi:hypothetical protein